MYEYLDGNGNKYVIKDKSIEYIPVKPAFSSSGVYDGGKHLKKEINELQNKMITSIVNNAMKNAESHIKNRVKLSGVIVIKEGNDEKTCILTPRSKELLQIEESLQDIIKS